MRNTSGRNFILMILYPVLLVILVSGCRSEDSTVKPRWPTTYADAGTATLDSDTRTNIEAYSIASAGMAKAFSEAGNTIFNGISELVASNKDFNSAEEISADAMDTYTDSLASALDSYAKAALYGYDMSFLGNRGITDKRADSFFIQRDASATMTLPDNGSDTGHSNQGNSMGYTGFIPFRTYGVLLRAVDSKIATGLFIINNSSEGSEEFNRINETMSLSAGSPKSAAISAFTELSVKKKLVKTKFLEKINRDYADGSAAERSKSETVESCRNIIHAFLESSPGSLYDTNETNAKYTKLQLMLKLTGEDPDSLKKSDLAFTGNGIASSTGTLGGTSSTLACIISTRGRSILSVGLPSVATSLDESKQALTSMAAYKYDGITSATRIFDFLNVLAADQAKNYYSEGIVSTGSDGSINISMPEKNYLRFLSKPSNNHSFAAPDFGDTDCLVTLKSYIPELYRNMNFIPAGFSIGLEYIEADSLTRQLVTAPSDKDRAVVTLVFPATLDVKPESDRNFIIMANPLVSGTDISYTATGADDWEQKGHLFTNTQGYVEFYMPASPDDTEDIVVIESGKDIKKEFKFKF